MAEIILNYQGLVTRTDGSAYSVQACGQPVDEIIWEGWLEFLPDDGSEVLRTGRETTQPNRADLEYWAAGLEAAYLEGALERALKREQPEDSPAPPAAPVYDGPAPHAPHAHDGPDAPIDPHHIHASQGDDVLRQQLQSIEEWQLRNVAIAHTDVNESNAAGLDREALIEKIMNAVRK